MSRSAAAMGCFALGWLVVAGAVRSFVPWPSDMRIADRVEHLRKHPGAYDTLFVGSSHFYRSFVPRVIDSELAKRSHSIRSFNMGTPGMSVFEMDFLIRSLLEQTGSNYRWIIFEYSFYPFDYPDRITSPHNYFSDRAVYWHTLGRTWDVVRATADSSMLVPHKLAISWIHTLHALWRFGGVAQGERIAAALLPSRPIPRGDYLRTGGYEALERGAGIAGRKERESFLETPGPFREIVATIDALNRSAVDADQLELRPLRSLQEVIRASGARPVVAIPAIPNATPALISLEEIGEIETLIALNSPMRFPNLYRIDRRFDGLHLNELGALEYSREFARLFAKVLDRVPEGISVGSPYPMAD